MTGADPESKSEWRRWAKARRRDGIVAPGRTVGRLAGFLAEEIPTGAWIVGYDALPGEVGLDVLAKRLAEMDLSFGMVRTPDEGFELTSHRWDSPREKHRLGFSQPAADVPPILDSAIGAVLVPGLIFDQFGIRIGFGSGYFDRFLGRLDPKVVRIGICSDQIVDRLPSENHDIPMTHLWGPDATGGEVQSVRST